IPVGLTALLLVGCGAPPAQPSAAPASAPAAAAPAQATAPPPAQSSFGPASAPAARPHTLTKVVQALPVESFGFLPMYVARAKGVFADEGLDVQTRLMGSSAALAGLLNGEVDFAVAGSGVRAAMQGAPMKAIMYTYNSVLFEFVVVPEIRTLEDLKGKNVGTSSRGGS